MNRLPTHTSTVSAFFLLLALALPLPGCGGGSAETGGGMILLEFRQADLDSVALNDVLKFSFSEALDPSTVAPASIQIRRGPVFGNTVSGTLKVDGPIVVFEPTLPGLCDFSDAGFQPDTQYRVNVIGEPEQFCLRSTTGQPLGTTTTYLFRTRSQEIFEDSVPGVAPFALSTTPADGSAEVPVLQGNEVVVEFSENIDPCSITDETVTFHMYEVGHIDEGFLPVNDNSTDPFTWGATNAVTTIDPAQRIPATVVLTQDFDSTRLTVTPQFGEFPENALLVLKLTNDILDYGGHSFSTDIVSFTTENLERRTGALVLEYDAETPMNVTGTTADVNTTRSPDRAQGFLLFSGDGDNGKDPYAPSLPNTFASACSDPLQPNNAEKDDFYPTGDVVLDTGDTVNLCPNSVDGSTAVVWEFKSFYIPSGVTVRVKGKNPAIILVQDGVVIESGGRLVLRGDGGGGVPRGTGESGTATNTNGTDGGIGHAGGGDGGDGPAYPGPASGRYGKDGVQGYFTTSTGATATEVGQAPGIGGGEGNTSGYWVTQALCNRNVPSGGGGGHATKGQSGTAFGTGTSPVRLELALKGGGGGEYPTDTRMLRAEAGSGGGAGGELQSSYGTPARGPGGAGGAGGGFVDLTSSGDIRILGTIDAAGSAGGKGAGNPFNPNYTYNPGTGGGGGGSGGGIRLITASNIILGATTVLTAAGGAGGAGGTNQGTAVPVNNGGVGGMGRIVLEDRDSVISGLDLASITPGEGTDGFERGVFDATRFSGGGLNTEALTMPILAGPIPVPGASPAYLDPVQTDFVAGLPQEASQGLGSTGMLVEARGWQMTSEGAVDEVTGPSEWTTVGSFADSGTETEPAWNSAAVHGIPTDVTLAPDNPGVLVGMGSLTGYGFLQVRLTFYLPSDASPLTAGPYVDRMALRFDYDQ